MAIDYDDEWENIFIKVTSEKNNRVVVHVHGEPYLLAKHYTSDLGESIEGLMSVGVEAIVAKVDSRSPYTHTLVSEDEACALWKEGAIADFH